MLSPWGSRRTARVAPDELMRLTCGAEDLLIAYIFIVYIHIIKIYIYIYIHIHINIYIHTCILHITHYIHI